VSFSPSSFIIQAFQAVQCFHINLGWCLHSFVLLCRLWSLIVFAHGPLDSASFISLNFISPFFTLVILIITPLLFLPQLRFLFRSLILLLRPTTTQPQKSDSAEIRRYQESKSINWKCFVLVAARAPSHFPPSDQSLTHPTLGFSLPDIDCTLRLWVR
jgi:hypothetical protein